MKKFIIALAATTALGAAMPAAAQYGGGNVQLRSEQLQVQLQAGIRSGAISRAEAMPLRDQLRQLRQMERQYAQGGITGRERADLQRRINSLRQGIRMAERNGNGRYDRDDREYGQNDGDRWDRNNDGWDDRDGNRDGRWDVDSRDDRDRDGWDDRDGNRDGRWDVETRNDSNRDGWDDRDMDRDGRWDDEDSYRRDQVSGSRDRGVVGQILDRVTGNSALRVGQQAPSNLGALPYEYRNQFRDGNGAYYRTDGRQIYQIDARSQTVVRIYAMNR